MAKKQYALMYNRKGMQLVDLKNNRVADLAILDDSWRDMEGGDVSGYGAEYDYSSYGGYKFCCVGHNHGWHHGRRRKKAARKRGYERNPYDRGQNPKKWKMWRNEHGY